MDGETFKLHVFLPLCLTWIEILSRYHFRVPLVNP